MWKVYIQKPCFIDYRNTKTTAEALTISGSNIVHESIGQKISWQRGRQSKNGREKWAWKIFSVSFPIQSLSLPSSYLSLRVWLAKPSCSFWPGQRHHYTFVSLTTFRQTAPKTRDGIIGYSCPCLTRIPFLKGGLLWARVSLPPMGSLQFQNRTTSASETYFLAILVPRLAAAPFCVYRHEAED